MPLRDGEFNISDNSVGQGSCISTGKASSSKISDFTCLLEACFWNYWQSAILPASEHFKPMLNKSRFSFLLLERNGVHSKDLPSQRRRKTIIFSWSFLHSVCFSCQKNPIIFQIFPYRRKKLKNTLRRDTWWSLAFCIWKETTDFDNKFCAFWSLKKILLRPQNLLRIQLWRDLGSFSADKTVTSVIIAERFNNFDQNVFWSAQEICTFAVRDLEEDVFSWLSMPFCVWSVFQGVHVTTVSPTKPKRIMMCFLAQVVLCPRKVENASASRFFFAFPKRGANAFASALTHSWCGHFI